MISCLRASNLDAVATKKARWKYKIDRRTPSHKK